MGFGPYVEMAIPVSMRNPAHRVLARTSATTCTFVRSICDALGAASPPALLALDVLQNTLDELRNLIRSRWCGAACRAPPAVARQRSQNHLTQQILVLHVGRQSS